MARNYRSCFITDVKIDKNIVLTDSQRNRYVISFTTNDMPVSEFKAWLTGFLRGVAQTLTVFQYEDRGEDMDTELHIVKFLNLPTEEKTFTTGFTEV